MIRLLKTPTTLMSRSLITAVIGVASLTGTIALAAPTQAAVATHAINSQTTAGHTVSPAGTRSWVYYGTYATEAECEAVGLAELEDGEAFDYLCSATETCPSEWQLYLYVSDRPAPDVVTVSSARRAAAARPVC